MILQDWIKRLMDAEGIKDVVDVREAADLAAAQADQRRDTIYVMYNAEQAGENLLSHGVQQPLTTTMAVVIAVTNCRDRRGAGGMTELETLRKRVREALLGWTPPAQAGPVTYQRGRLLQLVEATVWWIDEFTTGGWIAGPEQP